ncbi:hypothetical protein COEREDRAFT_88612 [Coemansia reversa NRRL 1564]|uniref:CoA-dependent acyltransferase n=1 Tax=Coemansia reversa (strain ATCC 12441 / NRRL 1564) TaxID=763665 RepID=A0A2G5B687_COERN|nr:hypothetical protein COEREDRAFT_88612 [Coemansia reversa NRRL 1564]|eukprot:PIA14514.1 hypothetical protein COEREDRAFT_88612 [Coemansia reversa NRRL 1564]
MENYQPQMLNIDRQWFWEKITAQSTPVDTTFDNHIEALEEANRKKLCSSLVNEEIPAGLVFDGAETDNLLYRISIPSQSVNKIGMVRSKICPEVSIPNFISAILWHCVFESSPDAKFSYFATSLTVRLNTLFSEYWGNAATMKYTYEKTEVLHSKEIGNIARIIQCLVDKYSVADFAHIVKNYNSKKYVENITRLVEENNPSRLMVSNISRLPVYSIDFGFGQPVKTAVAPHISPGFAVFSPRSKDGGIDILIRTLPKVIERLTNNSLLKEYISVINYQR